MKKGFLKQLSRRGFFRNAAVIMQNQRTSSVCVGSGTLLKIKYGSIFKIFFVTADHVIAALNNKVPITIITLGKIQGPDEAMTPLSELKIKAADILRYPEDSQRTVIDVAVVEIPFDAEVCKLCAKLSNIRLSVSSKNYFFTGLPSANLERVGRDFNCELLTYRARKVPNVFRAPSNSSPVDFFIRHRNKNLLKASIIRRSKRAPELHGMSGSGVWRYKLCEDGSLKNVQWVGVQKSYLRGAYIRATKLSYALRLIYKKYPELPDPHRIFVLKDGLLQMPELIF